MSKYDALADHLARQPSREHSMSFADVERVIGGRLPDSAREHRPWWANNEGSHVPRRGWLKAGFKTARVDMAGERVVFVREAAPPSVPEPTAETINLPFASLPLSVRSLIRQEAVNHGGDAAAAVAALLHGAVRAQRRAMTAEFMGKSTPGSDSVKLIREDRDVR